MINELYQLTTAIKNAEINMNSWHRKYLEIPNISEKTPCIRIVLANEHVQFVESISPEKKENIRKFGSNQGTFPAMNLACLFRINDEEQIEKINLIKKNIGNGIDINEIIKLCVHNNWSSERFKNKYKKCFENVPCELKELLKQSKYTPLEQLFEAINPFINPLDLHSALYERVLSMIEAKKHINLALNILFFAKAGKLTDFGNLSILLDSFELEEQGLSTMSINFTRGLNKALLLSEKQSKTVAENAETDAFGMPFSVLNDPMPKVKLPAGFEISLRTMFKGQPCQFRYGKIENDTYPISEDNRGAIKDALEWVSSIEMKNKTWISTNNDEVLFIYPNRLPKQVDGFVAMFASTNSNGKKTTEFQAQASAFAEYITKIKKFNSEDYPEFIQIFMLRKLDKARTKVIFSRITSPEEIIMKNILWEKATNNIPDFYSGIFYIPFPLDISEIMNHFWKQSGELSSDKFKPVKSYHGLELLFGLNRKEIEYDLQILMRNTQKLAVYAGSYFNTCNHQDDRKNLLKIKSTIILMGMLLYWLDKRKEDYMNEYPYLLGQLLKVSDNLHELYCYSERGGNLPPQLVGGSMYMSAAEFPKQTISQLAQRIMPYINWAKTHQNEKAEYKRKNSDGTETIITSLSAGYLLYIYSKISDKLLPVISEKTRFTDIEKACLFLGYLASFPKSSKEELMEISKTENL